MATPIRHPSREDSVLDMRLVGITYRSWLIATAVAAFCVIVYIERVPQTPNAFDSPAAQIPSRPWR